MAAEEERTEYQNDADADQKREEEAADIRENELHSD
jgi:hypothetical protein